MIRFLAGLFLALAVFAGPVLAEDAPAKKAPEFVPFVVDQQQDRAIREYLDGLPFKQAAPLVVWLNELEARAKARWEADNAPKGEEKPK